MITVAHIEFQFPINIFSLLRLSDAKICFLVAFIKRQLGFATQGPVIKTKVNVAKIEIQFLLNNLSLLEPIDTNLLYGYLLSRGS
jgi:hypothetical protein